MCALCPGQDERALDLLSVLRSAQVCCVSAVCVVCFDAWAKGKMEDVPSRICITFLHLVKIRPDSSPDFTFSGFSLWDAWLLLGVKWCGSCGGADADAEAQLVLNVTEAVRDVASINISN